MAFIDEIQFTAKAGNGGGGVVRWRHEKNKEYSGAAGGNGGRGGDVYVRAVRDLNILARYKTTKSFAAKNGDDGLSQSWQGGDGDDFYIDLPIGSIITNLQSGRVVELFEEGQTDKILHGGRGGLGNEHFKASTNIRPEQSTPGMEGESGEFKVEINLIADAGLIGLPNAGKSSLLNALTSARAKIGSYEFTTLDPNLGALPGGYILADLPGLIEGAAEGKGLGHKFLKHVKRTKVLLHIVAFPDNSSGMPACRPGRSDIANVMLENYSAVRKELEKFDDGLPEKEEIIILSKTDCADEKTRKEVYKAFGKFGKEILEVSVLDDGSVKRLGEELGRRLGTRD